MADPYNPNDLGVADKWLIDNIYNPLYSSLGLPTVGSDSEEETQTQPKTKPKKESDNSFDWSKVLELYKDTLVKPYTIEELATSKVPHNIPYLEVYRTDEILYRPYVSPYLSKFTTNDGDSSTSGDGYSEDSLTEAISSILDKYYPDISNHNYWVGELENAPSTWAGISRVINKMGGNREHQDNAIREILSAKNSRSSNTPLQNHTPTYSSLNKNKKLSDELKILVKNNFDYKKSTQIDSLVSLYMDSKTNYYSILAITGTCSRHLKNGSTATGVSKKVRDIKHKYG